MNLNPVNREMSLASLPVIRAGLDRIFGKDQWSNFELETISYELGYALDDLLRDKINVLQILESSPEMFTNDVLFFVHAVNVINNNIADFDHFPLPSSLELAYALSVFMKLHPDKIQFGDAIKKTVAFILNQEGYSYPVGILKEYGITAGELHLGQTEEDTKNKEKAVNLYIEGMNRV